MQDIKFHEIANIFPLIQGKEFVDLKQDIESNGVHQPIVMYEKKILDGRNRFRACQETGVKPFFIDYDGIDPVGYVVSLNLLRRHLTSDQRAASAVESLPQYEKEAKKRMSLGGEGREKIPYLEAGKASNKAAEIFGTNGRYVSDMKKLKEEEPETFEAIKIGDKRLVDVKKEKKKTERIERINDISSGNEDLNISKTYPVIYADPPWQYNHTESESRAIENHYPTMTLDTICEMPVSDLAAKDAILFLWTTSPKLEEGLRVLNSWGFSYTTCAIWDKQKKGLGYYFRQNHEILLIGKRGSFPTPEPKDRPDSIISEPRGDHSEKPERFYDIIEAMYPDFEKIELFCRSPRTGWNVWGNQSDT